MKKLKMFSCLVLIVFLIAALSTTVLAETLPTYKVTVSGGLYGTVNGQPEVTSTYHYGDLFNFYDYQVAIDSSKDPDGKYYFKGFHISGHESTFMNGEAITKDIVLVASYGVKGEMVDYTVHYLNPDGTRLLEDDTLSGKLGEEQNVPARHISGYIPNTYNYVFMLNGPREVTFFYTRVINPTPVPRPTPTPNPDDPNATPAPNTTPDPTKPSESAPPTVTSEPTPAVVIEVKETDVPSTSPTRGTITWLGITLQASTWTAIGISLVGLLGIVVFVVYMITHRKKS